MLFLISRINPVFIQEITIVLIILITIRTIIQIGNTLKSVMGMQDQTFKNCKKLMSSHKERGSNLDKCLSPYLNIVYPRPIKCPMKCPHLFNKMRGSYVKLPLISCFFIMVLNFGYIYIINCVLNKCVH